ncbi:MAG: hypothetical protein II625_09010 [Bacilli bacterium]|nr:hypothetical protein [Bacilli bacterium]
MDKKLENINKLLYETKFNYSESESKEDLFTNSHVKYNCEIANKNGSYLFTYQCNPKYVKIRKENVLACVLSDARCYQDCIIGSEDDNIQEFANMFGYDNIKECLKAYKGCKKASEKLSKMYTQEEQEVLYDYFVEKGEI